MLLKCVFEFFFGIAEHVIFVLAVGDPDECSIVDADGLILIIVIVIVIKTVMTVLTVHSAKYILLC